MKNFWTHENRAVLLLSLAFGFVFLDRNALNYLAPFLVQELSLSNTQLGMLSSGLSLTWAVSGFFLGLLADATGRRRLTLVAAVVVFSLCSVVSGIATGFIGLLAARVLMGVAEGPILPVAQAMMSSESSPARRGLNMGILQSLGSALLGSFVAPLLLVALAERYGWRTAFFVAAVPGLILAVALAKWLRDAVPVSSSAAGSATEPDDALKLRIRDIARQRNVWLCMVITCLLIAWMIVGWVFLPLYFVKVKGFSAQDMSIVMSVLGIAAALFGSFVGPWLSDRLGRRPIVVVLCLLGMLTPLAALYYDGPLAMISLLIFIGWSAAGAMPLVVATIPAESLPAAFVATGIGLTQGFGEIVGGVASPILAGLAADAYGLSAPLLIEAALAGIAAAFSLLLVETAPGRRKTAKSDTRLAGRWMAEKSS